VHGGSGYWSQDSLVQVMATRGAPSDVQVRWPGGKTTTNSLPANVREIVVSWEGKLEVIR